MQPPAPAPQALQPAAPAAVAARCSARIRSVSMPSPSVRWCAQLRDSTSTTAGRSPATSASRIADAQAFSPSSARAVAASPPRKRFHTWPCISAESRETPV